jgi:hypothetical protein
MPDMNRYRSASLNKDIYLDIADLIEQYPELHYRSVTHFVEVSIKMNPDYKKYVVEVKKAKTKKE